MAGATTKEASSSTFHCPYYDVFLSFRGPDTHDTFVGHLYKALVDAGFNTFKDDHGIERGEKIESELQKAIRNSTICLIVFSEKYASSRWCLDEVVQILQHKNTNIIIPIFYHVNPSHVRKQKRSYAEAFASHQDKLDEATVERWKAALREVADLAGMEIKDGDESKFVQKIVEEVSNKLYVQKQVDELETKLWSFNLLVNDVENMQYKNKYVKKWLDELKDVVYDAEDVIDDIATEALRKKLKSEDQSKTISSSELENGKTITKIKEITQRFDKLDLRDVVYDAEDVIDNVATEARSKKLMSEDQSQTISSSLPSFSSNPLSKIKNGKTIREIAQRFDKLKQDMSNLDLKHVALGSSSSSSTTTSVSSRETTSLMDESPVGRDGDKDKIIDLLLLPKESAIGEELSVIPIVGMGGLGKTTLAQMVYNDNDRLKDKDQFSPKAWVCVSNEFDVKRITKDILESVTPGPDWSKFNNLDQLQNKLKEALNGKKFLIVLDDVWDNSNFDWGLLRKPFRVGAVGSAIIVTTRDGKIASTMGTVDNHDLQSLSPDDCWSVFAHHAFRKTSVGANPNLVKIGKEIVSKCKGLPLAAKSLGGLLCSKEEEFEWKNVLNSEIWEREEENGILPVLILSYYYLKSHLKRCFAYCSIFPKDYEFKEEKVVSLWMAEGFLEQPEGKMNMEDFGRICFRELLLRSFFQPSSNFKGLFVMHDLMSDLAQWVAGKTCFRLDDSSDISKISHKARHCSFYGDDDKFEVFNKVDYLRTLLFLNTKGCPEHQTTNVIFDSLSTLKFVRVLSLCGYDNISQLPSSISDQKHLRYLDLSKTQIESLPDSVTTLYNLQTLLLSNCSRLKKLPEEMGNLINLRHLDISNSNLIEWMPPRLGRLTSLRELSDFVVGKDGGSGIGELMNLKHLRGTLQISKLENVIIDAQQAWKTNILSDKEGLNVLNMEWSLGFHDRRNGKDKHEVLEMLRPHEKLTKLMIRWYGGVSFPTWLGDPSFSNMVLLELEGCERCTALPPLGKLEKLKDLRIEGFFEVQKVGPGFYGEGCSNPFPSLETLIFWDMEKWKHWFSCETGDRVEVFPRLRRLHIEGCPELLGNLPDHLPSLEELDVHRCKRLTVTISSFPRLWKLNIDGCQEVVQRSNVDISSLKSMSLRNISKATFLTTGIHQGLTGVEYLRIVGCDELVSLWQNEWSLRQHVTLLRHLVIGNCPWLVSLVAEEEEELQEQGLPYSCRLESLEIEGCGNLENMKGLHHLTSLRELTIKGCSRLVSFPKSGLPAMLRQLKISDCSALRYVVDAISWHNCSNTLLEQLDIDECDSLMPIPRAWLLSRVKKLSIRGCTSLQYIWDEDDASSSSAQEVGNNCGRSLLEDLSIEDCPSLTSLSSSSIGELPLEKIRIRKCESLKSLPEGLRYLRDLSIMACPNLFSLKFGKEMPARLESLRISSCPKLKSIGGSFHNNTPLEEITIYSCVNLKSLPENLHILPRLSVIHICDCPSLLRFPDRGLPTANLKRLEIRLCGKLKVLPPMHDLTQLQELIIRDCPRIKSFPKEGFPTNITSLYLRQLNIPYQLVNWGLHILASLRILWIEGGCSDSASDVVSFPADEEFEMVLPSSLVELAIVDFPNLERLSSNGFQNLSSLQVLTIDSCPMLQSFPNQGLFPSLLELDIYKCPLLVERCEKDRGQEWPKISHVPSVMLDETGDESPSQASQSSSPLQESP